MLISLTFSLIIFSILVLQKGLNGFDNNFNLEVIKTIILVFIYSLPVLIIEKLTRQQDINKKNYTKIFLQSLLIALLSTFLWTAAFISFSHNSESGLLIFYAPILLVVFFILNFVLFLIISYLNNLSLRIYKIILFGALFISILFLIYGTWMIAKCDQLGCLNSEYFIKRAIKENDPTICNLADEKNILIINMGILSILAQSEKYPYGDSTNDCYYGLVEKTNDKKICEIMKKEKNTCYKQLADKNKDASFCEKIITTEPQGEWERNDCFYQLARLTHNKFFCEKISQNNWKEKCEAGEYY
jgi:hypothetical protein